MKYSYNWLKELSGTKLSPEKTAELLTMRSFELEGMEKSGQGFEGVVVGKILEIKKHPNADKLQLTRVDISKEKLDIVCGAENIKIGDKVPVATVGTKLPGGLKIKEAEIRGEKSYGMLCAMDELGIGEDYSGIIILDTKAKVGEAVEKYLGIENDVIFEIKVLPDRAHDAMSHVGVAREVAVLSGKKLEYDFEGLEMPARKTKKLKVEIKDKKLCSRYIGAVLEEIEIKESPSWMKSRLAASGINSINNVVDATNYVMLEIGQPLHAFDLEKIKNQNTKRNNIVVRRANDKEKLTLLDESQLELNNSDLLITNGNTSLALAGIMGGKDSGINENTKTIVLEAANFNAVNTRRTRARLALRTEAADRFEKEIDPNLCEKAIARVIEILEHIANAKLEGIIDAYPKKIKPWKIKLDFNYVNSLLGEDVPFKDAVRILNLLDIKTKKQRSDKIECTIPTVRIDIRTPEDLIEEIGRLRGYDNIALCSLISPVIGIEKKRILFFERHIKELVSNLGYDEVYNYSFYSQLDADWCGLLKAKHFGLINPMSPEQELVRVSLIPNILRNIRENLKHFKNFNIFEIGRAYYSSNEEVKEKRILAMAEILEKDKNAETFLSLKGSVEGLLESIGIDESLIYISETKVLEGSLWHLERVAEIKVNDVPIGIIGEINPPVLTRYKIERRVAMAEIDLKKLCVPFQKEIIYSPIQKFPTVTRDISMLTSADNTVAKITDFIRKSGGNLVLNVEMFDVFRKNDKTSLAFHIEFGAGDRTLENAEVDTVMEKITSSLEKELRVEVRK